MKESYSVIKRDGSKVPFDSRRIVDAIVKANDSCDGGMTLLEIVHASLQIEQDVKEAFADTKSVHVEQIQDFVENHLMTYGQLKVAKEYITYRSERSKVRSTGDALMRIYNKITDVDARSMDDKRENANIDGDSAMGVMLKYGTEGSKFYTMNYVLPKDLSAAHMSGDIHIHDLDFFALTETCCQIDLLKLFKNGFSTGHGFLREPNSITSYAALACIAIQANQNDQHGGQSIPNFDYCMAPGVAKTFVKEYVKAFCLFMLIQHGFNTQTMKERIADIKVHLATPEVFPDALRQLPPMLHVSEDDLWKAHRFAFYEARKQTEILTYQAMEALVHNFNTLNSRAGSQVPFSSLNYGTDTSEEGRMVVRNLLKATQAGMGAGETPIFPVQIFKVKEGVNYFADDPNYDLFMLAIETTSKRLFPNFSFLDAPFNLQYYKPGDYNSEVAYMGCSQVSEIVGYSYGGSLNVEGIGRMFDRFAAEGFEVRRYGQSEYIDLEGVTVWDSNVGGFVKVKKVIRNPNKQNWTRVKFSDGRVLTLTADHPLPVEGKGRTFVKDLKIGDVVPRVSYVPSEETVAEPTDSAWFKGMMLCDGCYANVPVITIGPDELDLYHGIKAYCDARGIESKLVERNRGVKGHYFDVKMYPTSVGSTYRETTKKYVDMFGGLRKAERHIPNEVFSWSRDAKVAFLAGMIDSDGYIRMGKGLGEIALGSTNQELAKQQAALAMALGFDARIRPNWYKGKQFTDKIRWAVQLRGNRSLYSEVLKELRSLKKGLVLESMVERKNQFETPPVCDVCRVESIEFLGAGSDSEEFAYSYDLETASDRFDLSGINSHNCRTRVMGNVYDPEREVTCGRGNLSFTTINLPRLAIKAEGDVDAFFKGLENMMVLVKRQLLHRLGIQGKKKVKNYPFLMGNGIWLDSDDLDWEDEVLEALKHGTLTIGFIGLAETLMALIGKHHGESEEAQELGLRIVKFMRDKCDEFAEAEKLNFTLIATPAESLSSRFLKLDKVKFGEMEGITDKAYYTNSFHVPVWFNIKAFKKIEIEAPYHALTNAGHISYVELDGDAAKNPEAVKSILRFMHDKGIGYGSVNHPVDRDPVCGYTGVINGECPRCGRKEGEGVSVERLKELRKTYPDVPKSW